MTSGEIVVLSRHTKNRTFALRRNGPLLSPPQNPSLDLRRNRRFISPAFAFFIIKVCNAASQGTHRRPVFWQVEKKSRKSLSRKIASGMGEANRPGMGGEAAKSVPWLDGLSYRQLPSSATSTAPPAASVISAVRAPADPLPSKPERKLEARRQLPKLEERRRQLPIITTPPEWGSIVVTGGTLGMSGTLHRVDGFFWHGNVLNLEVSASWPPFNPHPAKRLRLTHPHSPSPDPCPQAAPPSECCRGRQVQEWTWQVGVQRASCGEPHHPRAQRGAAAEIGRRDASRSSSRQERRDSGWGVDARTQAPLGRGERVSKEVSK